MQRSDDVGFVPFLERRAPPKSIVPQRGAPSSKMSVGGEVDSWCGKCKEMTTHNVVAMVGEQPKQVICQVCNSRHDYPHRAAGAPQEGGGRRRGGGGDASGEVGLDGAAQRGPRAAATAGGQARSCRRSWPRQSSRGTFDPKARYKSGEIIVHPEHGRGKIENVLRGSLLVRFLEGLRPLDLA